MKIVEDADLLKLNSFGVETRADKLVEWEAAEELREVDFTGRCMALGGGHNVLFVGDFPGTLVKSAARKIVVLDENPEKVAVRVEAGADWGDFVEWAVGRELWGVENLAGIPGTVGAAPIQNIGAYGAEVGDVIARVECFDTTTGRYFTVEKEECELGYRESVFKRRREWIVTAVEMELSKRARANLKYGALAETVGEGAGPEEIARAVKTLRENKLPDVREAGNAGSFFKNPVVAEELAHDLGKSFEGMPHWPAGERRTKLAAGWLIEKAGWKGRTEGRVGVHEKQALIVVNRGGATGREILEFARRIVEDVRGKFGVTLEMEVNVIC